MDGKYFISMADDQDEWSLYCLDTEQGTWWRQDEKEAIAFARIGEELYMLEAEGKLWSMSGKEGEKEEPVHWRMDSAVMGYEYPDHKYIWRFNLRMMLGSMADCAFYIEYDSSGIWEEHGYMTGREMIGTYTLPIMPRRCDHMRIRLEGTGEIQLLSIARVLAMGADG